MSTGNANDKPLSDSHRPPLRADARRNYDRILRAALEHFYSRGINASLEDIARAAGVGPGTLYRHFPSREALLAAALRDRQAELLQRAEAARGLADADAALAAWLEALQSYLRTFNGLPAPLAAAVKEQASPLALSCQNLLQTTAEFLARAQQQGNARAGVTANELFLATLGMAWVSDQVDAYGTTREALQALFAHGYLND